MRKVYLRYFLFTLIFIILFFLISYNINSLQKFVQLFFNPFQKITIQVRDNFLNFVERQETAEKLNNEIHKLKKEIAAQKLKNKLFYNYYLENERLRKLLNLKENMSLATISAQIISYNPTNWLSTCIIDKGEENGAKIGNAVINYEGLVGRIYKVEKNHSLVLFILDKNSHTGASLQKTNVAGVLTGESKNYCILEYLPSGIDVKIGEEVITSGLGENTPFGIPIGRVVEVKKEINEPLYVKVKPYVSFNSLKEVLVVKSE